MTAVLRTPEERFSGVRRFPQRVPDRPDAPRAAVYREARTWLRETWSGPAFMAVGVQDTVPGPPVMRERRAAIRGCMPPLENRP